MFQGEGKEIKDEKERRRCFCISGVHSLRFLFSILNEFRLHPTYQDAWIYVQFTQMEIRNSDKFVAKNETESWKIQCHFCQANNVSCVLYFHFLSFKYLWSFKIIFSLCREKKIESLLAGIPNANVGESSITASTASRN